MTYPDFAPRLNEDNPDPRVACVLALDTSYSMSGDNGGSALGSILRGSPIDELNQGMKKFAEDANADDLTRKQAEVCIIKFGPYAEVVTPFCEVREFTPPRLNADGGTPMGAAIDLAIDELESRKQQYREGGIEYFRRC